MDTICQAFLKVVSLSGLIKPNILLVLSQANLLLMLAIVCSVLCNIMFIAVKLWPVLYGY